MKKIRFIVSLLLTAAMLPGVLPLGVHAVTMIDEIRILDYQRPLIGQTAGENIAQLTVPQGAHYSVRINTRWFCSSTKPHSTMMSESDTFEAYKRYYLVLYVEPDSGYRFDSSVKIYINGSEDLISYVTTAYDPVISFRTSTVLPQIPFDGDPVRIDEVVINGYRQPIIGQTAGGNLNSLSVPEGAHYSIHSDTNWYKAQSGTLDPSDVFAEGAYYWATVYIAPDAGYYFDDDARPTVTVNGSAEHVSHVWLRADGDGRLDVGMDSTTPAGGLIPIDEVNVTGFLHPSTVRSVSENLAAISVPEGAPYKIYSKYWWSPSRQQSITSGLFPDEPVSLVVMLTPLEGYYIAETAVPHVNGGGDGIDRAACGLNSYKWIFNVCTEPEIPTPVTMYSLAQISGYERPIVGDSVGDSLAAISLPAGVMYSISDICWYNVTNDVRMPEDGSFIQSKKYELRVTLQTTEESSFAADATATVNGSGALVNASSYSFSESFDSFSFSTNAVYVLDPIFSVSVTGYVQPTVGQTAGDALSEITLPAGAQYSLDEIFWMNGSGTKMMPGDTFSSGGQYYLSVRFSPKIGNVFTDDTSATVNGSAELIDAAKTGVDKDGNFRLQTQRCAAKIDSTITAVDVTLPFLPVIGMTAGEFPAPSVSDGACYTIGSSYWFNETDNARMSDTDVFAGNKQYYLFVNLIPDAGFAFEADASPFINGSTDLVDTEYSKVRAVDGAFLLWTVSLSPTAPEAITEVNVTGFTPPAVGQTAGGNLISVALPDGAPYAVASLDWENGTTGEYMEIDDCFEAGQEYHLRFDLSPAAGYVFAEHCSVLINGGADRVNGEFTTQNEDGTLTFYTVNYALTDALRGDVDRDGTVNISDVTELLNILAGAKTEDPALCDLNGDGYVNISDVTELLDILAGA